MKHKVRRAPKRL